MTPNRQARAITHISGLDWQKVSQLGEGPTLAETTNMFTVEDLIAEADAKHPHMEIDGVTLRNLLWLPPKQREEFKKFQEKSTEDDSLSVMDLGRKIVALTVEDPKEAKRLLGLIPDRVAVWQAFVDKYFEVTQAGEASPSPAS